MPTDEKANGASPTGVDVTASPELLALTPEQLEAHPHVQELKKKYSAAHQDMDKTNLSRKELQAELAKYKTLAGVEDVVEKKDEPQTVTKQELQEQVWELKNAKEVELYGDDEYQKDLTAGIPRDYALKTARLRYQSTPEKARIERQQQMASGTAMGTRNLQSDDLTDKDRADMAKWGYSEYAVRRQKELKRERGQL